MRTWQAGPPPHIGWWNASISKDNKAWRWWNGERWSFCARQNESAVMAGHLASRQMMLAGSNNVLWTKFYPKGARVRRVKPKS